MAELGRPTVFTPEVCKKIEEVAALDGSVSEMAFYAGITRQSIYNYFNANPDFFDRIEALREKPVLLARQTIVKSLSDPNHAFRYVERKRPKEWMPTSKVEHSGAIDTPVPAGQLATAAADAIRERYELELRSTIVKPSNSSAEGQKGTNPAPVVVELGVADMGLSQYAQNEPLGIASVQV